jgi:ribosomal protein S18 acetylase RimI-like enzyme
MNRPHPGPATLAAEIGLAEAGEVALLQEIERRACDLFLAIPATASLPSSLTSLTNLEAAQRAGLLWVARAGGSPVGFALLESLGGGLHLEELDVLPEHGRKGIGRALVREVCRYAEAQRSVLTLCTFAFGYGGSTSVAGSGRLVTMSCDRRRRGCRKRPRWTARTCAWR